MMSLQALEFLKSCKWNERSHEERKGLIALAKELYPDPLEKLLPGICMYNTDNTGCRGNEDDRCEHYKCYDCYWL